MTQSLSAWSVVITIIFFYSSYGLLTCSYRPHPSSRWCRDLSAMRLPWFEVSAALALFTRQAFSSCVKASGEATCHSWLCWGKKNKKLPCPWERNFMTSEQQLGCEGGPLNSWHLARVPFQSQMSKFIILTLCPAAIVLLRRPQSSKFLCYLFLLHCSCTLQWCQWNFSF